MNDNNESADNSYLIVLPWQVKAKCHLDPRKDHTFFYPKGRAARKEGGRVDAIEAERARYCHGLDDGIMCPVRIKCLEHALEVNEGGVWGGMTEKEREQLRRSRENKKRKSA